MARTAVTAVTDFLVIPLGRVAQESDAREHQWYLPLGIFTCNAQGGMAGFAVTVVTTVRRWWVRHEQGEGTLERVVLGKLENPDFVTERA
jgi:hypothetical protein